MAESAEFSSEQLGQLDEAMRALTGPTTVAGLATLITRYGQIVHQGCYGQLDLAAGRPVGPDSLFRLASVTKAMTAAAVMKLHELGRLGLNEPVSRWLPGMAKLRVLGPGGAGDLRPLEREITIQHLLTHTAGFGYGFEPDDPLAERYEAAGFFNRIVVLQMPLAEMARRLCDLPLASQPGERYRYSLAYDLLGYLVELIGGQPLGDFLHEQFCLPLGMPDTGFWVPPEKLERFGPLYGRPNEAGLAVLDPAAGAFATPDVHASGGGGLVSTLSDLGRFVTMLVNGGEVEGVRVLRPESVSAMLSNHVTGQAPHGVRVGFGVELGLDGEQAGTWPKEVFGVSGGYGTLALGCRPTGLVLICLAQSFPNAQPARRFAELAFAAAGG